MQALGHLVQLGCLVGRAGIEVRLLKEPRIPWRPQETTLYAKEDSKISQPDFWLPA